MPSPFPGMDPFLEGSRWMGIHSQLSAEIARQLTPSLVPKYVALTNERFVFESPEDVAIASRATYPDVGVVPLNRTSDGGERPVTAVASPAPLMMATVMPESVPHVTVEIRDTARQQLVTAIEVLSPTNKRGDGREEYLAKRQRLLLSTAHLIEIDLLRAGTRIPMQRPLPSLPYFVFVSRAERRPMLEVHPIRLDQPLPTINVPLLPGDADCRLDLQLAFTTVYDALRYDLVVDYRQPLEIPLPPDAMPWVEERLKQLEK